MMRCGPGTVTHTHRLRDYTHRLRDGPGPAVHRFAIARAAPHPGHVRPYLSAYGLDPRAKLFGLKSCLPMAPLLPVQEKERSVFVSA